VSRGAWVFAALGLAAVALLMVVMGRALDTKAPILLERNGASAAPTAPPVRAIPPAERDALETAAMRAVVSERAPALAARAAEQSSPAGEAGRATCTFTDARLVHREGSSAFWSADFSCADPRVPGALPNLTSVSVRLRRDGVRWTVED
jgi:hypothetical protein